MAPPLFPLRDSGQGLVEYGMIIILAAIVVVAILTLLGPAIGNMFSSVVGNI